jgi:hypothetical protein
MKQAVASFDALKIINYVKGGKSVRDENYSHRILEMVPDRITLQADFHLDFLSNYIAEEVIAKVETDSLETLSAFLISDDSESTSVIRGRIYSRKSCYLNSKIDTLYDLYRIFGGAARSVFHPNGAKIALYMEESLADVYAVKSVRNIGILTSIFPTAHMLLHVVVSDDGNYTFQHVEQL